MTYQNGAVTSDRRFKAFKIAYFGNVAWHLIKTFGQYRRIIY